MFCTRCGRESKEGANFCMGCGTALPEGSAPRKTRDTQKGTGWALIIPGVIIAGLGMYFTSAASHDIDTAELYGEWWLTLHDLTLGELYAYQALGIVGIVIGAILAITGVRKVWMT